MGSEMSLFGKEKGRASSKKNPDEHSKWNFASFVDEHEGKKVKKGKVYSIWGAMRYTMILSLLLWWLPVFGQMIAGYIGGRKAGSPWKGVISAILPVVALFAGMGIIDHFLSQGFVGSSSASSSLVASFAAGVPIVGPYLDFTRDYVMKFLDSLAGSSPYGMNSYIITLAFAYIGGILADQTRREIEAVSGGAGSHTMVVVAPNERAEGSHNTASSHFGHIPLVGSFMSGKMPSHKLSRRQKRVDSAKSFDGMVAIRNVEGVQAEEEVASATASAQAHGGKHARKLKAMKTPAAVKHERAVPARHEVERERPSIALSNARPNTFKTAQRRIEKEWDPSRKMRTAGSPPIVMQKHHSRQTGETTVQVRQNVIRRPPTRNWDTI
jgi:hypothetical protein